MPVKFLLLITTHACGQHVARVATTPEEMIPALVRASSEFDLAQIAQPHFFTFGGALATAQWIRAVSIGAFQLRPDGKLELNG